MISFAGKRWGTMQEFATKIFLGLDEVVGDPKGQTSL